MCSRSFQLVLAFLCVLGSDGNSEPGSAGRAGLRQESCENAVQFDQICGYVPYNVSRYNLAPLVRRMLRVGNLALDEIHSLIGTNNMTNADSAFYDEIPVFGVNDRESVFVRRFYDSFDTDYTCLQTYLDFVLNEVKPLFPDEVNLLIQKTPNLRVHVPGNSNIGTRSSDPSADVIGLHSDGEFNHPIGELNFIVPITAMFASNSLYHEPSPQSLLPVDQYINIRTDTDQFWYGNLNQLKHYNRINRSGKTRISLDFRVLPASKYQPRSAKASATSKNKFVAGDYYVFL